MHAQLEKYFSQIEKQLSILPEKQRQDELREVRCHLEMMIDENIAQGCDLDDAVAKALEQFGPPVDVGRGLQNARYSKRYHYRRMFYAGFAALIIASLSSLITRFVFIKFGVFDNRALMSDPTWLLLGNCLWSCVEAFFIGWAIETFLPKRDLFIIAVKAILFAIFWGITLLMFGAMALSAYAKLFMLNTSYYVGSIVLSILMTYLGAWARRRHVEHQQIVSE